MKTICFNLEFKKKSAIESYLDDYEIPLIVVLLKENLTASWMRSKSVKHIFYLVCYMQFQTPSNVDDFEMAQQDI